MDAKVEYIKTLNIHGDTNKQIDLVKVSTNNPDDKPAELLCAIRYDTAMDAQRDIYNIYVNVDSVNAYMESMEVVEAEEQVAVMYKRRVARCKQIRAPFRGYGGYGCGVDRYFEIPETTPGATELGFINWEAVGATLCKTEMFHHYPDLEWLKHAMVEVGIDAKVNVRLRQKDAAVKKGATIGMIGMVAIGAGLLIASAGVASAVVGSLTTLTAVAIAKGVASETYGMLTATKKRVVGGVTLEDMDMSVMCLVRVTRATKSGKSLIFGVRSHRRGNPPKPMLHVESFNKYMKQYPAKREEVPSENGVVLVRRTTYQLDNPRAHFVQTSILTGTPLVDDYFVVDRDFAWSYYGEYVTTRVLVRLEDFLYLSENSLYPAFCVMKDLLYAVETPF